MRSFSVAAMKGFRRTTPDGLPSPGSLSRQIYDRLFEHKGKIVSLNDLYEAHRKSIHHAIADLENFWGCDIRSYRKCLFSLVGEWFGKVYIDYTQDQPS